MRIHPALSVVLLFIVGAGCHAPRRWDGRVYQWGTMREALGQGECQGRVRLRDALKKPHAYGVGALAGLAGEISVIDGRVWIARVRNDPEPDPDKILRIRGLTFPPKATMNEQTKEEGIAAQSCETSESAAAVEQATLLAIAFVPHWRLFPLPGRIQADRLEAVIRETAEHAGLSLEKPIPFMITGPMDVDGHVINGSCPHADSDDDVATPPFRFRKRNQPGTAVGFFAQDAAGSLTHHSERTHAHVLFAGPPATSGHVDTLSPGPGAILHLPASDRNNY